MWSMIDSIVKLEAHGTKIEKRKKKGSNMSALTTAQSPHWVRASFIERPFRKNINIPLTINDWKSHRADETEKGIVVGGTQAYRWGKMAL